eukprot:m.130136 g.130136  ORF g.130136 m.130136 type:complete len:283 (+) comp29460_c5_seq3:821-1669(+)
MPPTLTAGKKKRPQKQKLSWASKLGLGKKTAKLFRKLPQPPSQEAQAAKAEALLKAKGNSKKKNKKTTGSNSRMPYIATDLILLVGEGDFSFSAALTTVLKGSLNITATAYDSLEHVQKKYDTAEDHIDNFKAGGGTEVFNVDATKLDTNKLLGTSYDCIVFNFPHCGFGIKDKLKNILSNRKLILGFLTSAVKVLHPKGEIHITVKKGEPYDSWGLVRIALSLGTLRVKNSFDFQPSLYPEYNHRRTIGFKEGLSSSSNEEILKNGAKTFVFALKKHDHED